MKINFKFKFKLTAKSLQIKENNVRVEMNEPIGFQHEQKQTANKINKFQYFESFEIFQKKVKN